MDFRGLNNLITPSLMVVTKIIKEGYINGGHERGSYTLIAKAQFSASKNEKTEYSLQENISFERFIENLDSFSENIAQTKSSVRPVLFIDEAQVNRFFCAYD